MSEVPVIAAIPNYNMAESLAVLLPRVLEQGYDHVYVLDDASTDHSAETVQSFGPEVSFIAGEENLGPGGNRNRILGVSAKHLGNAILHFIDADLTLDSKDNPDKAREIFSNETIGLAGGLISLPDGTPWMFNYGSRYSLYSMRAGAHQIRYSALVKSDPQAAAAYKKRKHFWLQEAPDISQKPSRRQVFWASEANMLVPYKLFKQVGGFDPRLLYHEVQDLSIKIHRAGQKAVFDPAISVVHPYVDLDDMNRRAIESRAGLKIMLKYGPRLK